jgi:hypothetical protein
VGHRLPPGARGARGDNHRRDVHEPEHGQEPFERHLLEGRGPLPRTTGGAVADRKRAPPVDRAVRPATPAGRPRHLLEQDVQQPSNRSDGVSIERRAAPQDHADRDDSGRELLITLVDAAQARRCRVPKACWSLREQSFSGVPYPSHTSGPSDSPRCRSNTNQRAYVARRCCVWSIAPQTVQGRSGQSSLTCLSNLGEVVRRRWAGSTRDPSTTARLTMHDRRSRRTGTPPGLEVRCPEKR